MRICNEGSAWRSVGTLRTRISGDLINKIIQCVQFVTEAARVLID